MPELTRFNTNHFGPGAKGGQFAPAGGGGGGKNAPAKTAPGKAPAKPAPAHGKGHGTAPHPAPQTGPHTPRQRLLAEAHADRQRAAELEKQLHVLEKQHAAATAAAKHSAAQAKAAKKAGHVVHHHHHTAAHHRHRKHAATLAQRISHLRTEIHTLRQKAAHLEAQAKAARSQRDVSELQFGHGSALWKYWTTGGGFAKWSGALHKWRTLRDLLLKAGVPAHSVDGLTTNIIMAVMPGYMKQAHKGRSAMDPDRAAPAKKPYGNVEYADPKNGKYPIDTKAHAQAAWSYINMPKNAAQYPMNGVTLASVKARIMAACRKFGIMMSEDKSAQHAPDLDVVRTGGGLELQPGGNGLGVLTGRFSEFGRWYPVDSKFEGEFLERVAPGSTADTISGDRDRMRVLFDHGTDRQIGNKVLGPIDVLEERSDGPYYEVPLFDTSYNRDLLPGLKAGVYGASMRMRVTGDEWNDSPARSESNPQGIPERTITRMRVLEFGPVTFPANPGASAGVRSGTDEFYFRMRDINAPAFEDAVRASGRSREYFELPVIGRPPAGARAASDREGDAPVRAKPDQSLITRFRADGEALALRGIEGVRIR